MKWKVVFEVSTAVGGMVNSNPAIVDDKKSIIITCYKWNVDYLDFFSGSVEYNGEIKTYSEIFDVEYNTYINDAVHLTEDGYKIMVPFIIEWMNKLSIYEKNFEVIIDNSKMVISFEELVYTVDYVIVSNGAYGLSSGRAASVGCYLKVNFGETHIMVN